MTAVTRRQDGREAQPRHHPSVRHKQPERVRARGCDRQKKGPELPAQPMRSADARRSAQATRRGQSGAWGEEKACRGDAAFVGGDRKQPPRQACSRPLHEAGRFRLPGNQGLERAWPLGRRRAEARGVRGALSFGCLRKVIKVIWQNPAGSHLKDPTHLIRTGNSFPSNPLAQTRHRHVADLGCHVVKGSALCLNVGS